MERQLSHCLLNTSCVSGFVFLVVLDVVVGRCLAGHVDGGRFGGLVVFRQCCGRLSRRQCFPRGCCGGSVRPTC